ncbi:hypothetical protein CDAR_378731 [Caerostris darwini]|uniref:Uncharacterized protein n=1 Tax=Caerostris darwini TaxID=1538125 RepID=A0AAV4MTH5_9ARAC|nr:hypothetical protein CDAR_378731 [Caerostris darwini]
MICGTKGFGTTGFWLWHGWHGYHRLQNKQPGDKAAYFERKLTIIYLGCNTKWYRRNRHPVWETKRQFRVSSIPLINYLSLKNSLSPPTAPTLNKKPQKRSSAAA